MYLFWNYTFENITVPNFKFMQIIESVIYLKTSLVMFSGIPFG